MEQDPTYPRRFEQARRRWFGRLEDQAVRLAHDGIEKPVLYKGKQVHIQGQPLVEREFSVQMLLALLKAGDRQRYGEQLKIDLSHIKTIHDVPPELLKLVLDKLQEDYDAQQAARRIEAGEATSEQIVEIKAEPPTLGGQS